MKEMHVFGMELKDYSVKEAMRMVDAFLQDAKVNIISFLSPEILMEAGEDEEMRSRLSSIDLTVPVSTEILKAAGIGGRSRLAEVEEGRFYKELLKKLSNEKRTAFILTEKEETVEPFVAYLSEAAPGLKIVGHYAFENLTGDPDIVVNEINSTFPDIVLSRLSSPKQEQFACEQNAKLNARLWIALREDFVTRYRKNPSGFEKWRQAIRTKLFRRRVLRFTNEQEDTGENS
ncbi:MAG: WecB/TagA/CpsF family glycosyltransferase [Lachnospiraceae bacterium]|nr:WecB/TagA/CpsF family glycosyltransferase [Lachnospiraceae bacterium]